MAQDKSINKLIYDIKNILENWDEQAFYKILRNVKRQNNKGALCGILEIILREKSKTAFNCFVQYFDVESLNLQNNRGYTVTDKAKALIDSDHSMQDMYDFLRRIGGREGHELVNDNASLPSGLPDRLKNMLETIEALVKDNDKLGLTELYNANAGSEEGEQKRKHMAHLILLTILNENNSNLLQYCLESWDVKDIINQPYSDNVTLTDHAWVLAFESKDYIHCYRILRGHNGKIAGELELRALGEKEKEELERKEILERRAEEILQKNDEQEIERLLAEEEENHDLLIYALFVKAIRQNRSSLVEVLLNVYQFNVNYFTEELKTPLDHAEETESFEVAALLHRNGAHRYEGLGPGFPGSPPEVLRHS